MISKAHLHFQNLLKKICKIYNLTLMQELKNGDKKYDFYIPTFPPIVIEVDGVQHFATKTDGFFFKDEESLRKYKSNDREREIEHKLGHIKMFRFKTDQFPTLNELIEHIGEDLLKGGINDKDFFYKKVAFNKEISERKKIFARDQANKIKQESRNGSRFIKK